MPYKDILVHVDSAALSGATVDAALALAERHDAHLVGLGIRAPLEIPLYAEVRLPDPVFEIMKKREDERLSAAKADFESRAKHAGRTERCEWREDWGDLSHVLGLHARYSDIVIGTQGDPDVSDQRSIDLAQDVMFGAGRPILIVPKTGASKPIGDTIVVAWNGSREAARALADAMPMLARAKSVEIFIGGAPDIDDLPGADIGAHLARHGITVDVHQVPGTDQSVGDMLLNRVSDSGADLVVMGGYGRSRFREMILGGVTRHMIQHMTVPVMMSH